MNTESAQSAAVRPPLSNKSIGVLMTLTACFLFGATGTVVRLGVQASADTSAVMVVQCFVSAVVAFLFLGERPRLERGSVGTILALSVVAALNGIGMIEGYARLGVAPVAVIMALYPGVVGLLQWAIEGRRPTGMWFAALGTAVAGVAMAMIGGPTNLGRPWWEYLLPVMTTIGLAVNDLLVQRLVVNVRPAQVIAWINLFIAMLMLVFYNQRAWTHLDESPSWITGLALGGMLYLALQLKFRGIARVGAAVVSLIAASQPILALLVAAVVLGEALSGRQYAGVALVVAALVMITNLKEQSTIGNQLRLRKPIAESRLP